MEDGSLSIIPTEDIRSEPQTYPELIVKAVNRALFLAPKFVEKYNSHSLRTFETLIRGLHGATSPYHSETYKKNVMIIKSNLSDEDLLSKNYNYSIWLLKWLEEISSLFPKMGVLPATTIDEYDLATPEILEEERKEATIKYIKKILKDKGESELNLFLDEIKNPTPKPIVVKPKLTIADVIDKSYLTEEDLKEMERLKKRKEDKEDD